MSKVNFNAIEEHVNTKYGDLTGIIQIDGINNILSVYDLCKDHNFNTSNIFIIGFGLSESTVDGVGKSEDISCSVFYVDKAAYGSNFDEISRKIKADGTLKLKKKNIDLKYSELGKYVKRFEFMAMTELAKSAATIEIDEEV